MDELQKLRMEFKTDVEMLAIGHSELAKDVYRISGRVDGQGGEIAEQGREIAEQARRIDEQARRIDEHAQTLARAHQETARLGREFARKSQEMEGRTRLMGERLERILLIAEHEYTTRTVVAALDERVRELTERVERLEKDRPPAA